MSFLKLDLKIEYRTTKCDVENDFFIPVLREAKCYKRGVGYFSSSALAKISRGLECLAINNGNIQLLCSPQLSEEDYKAIKEGYKLRDIIEKTALEDFKIPNNDFEKESLNMLANLIAQNILDIKLVLMKNGNQYGMYHEKVGIVIDADNNKIAFSGSMNESENAFDNNYDLFDVYQSWNNQLDNERVKAKEEAFDLIWNNNEETVVTIEVPEIKSEFVKRYKNNNIDFITYEPQANSRNRVKIKNIPVLPEDINLDRTYQIPAINEWKKNNFCGIFNMATGTGKTYTGLGGVVRLSTVLNYNIAIFIIVPYQHLVDQWVEDIRKFNMEPIIAYSSSSQKDWKDRLKNAIFDQKLGIKPFFCYVSTYNTFCTSFVQKQIERIKGNIALVVDEAHNIGAPYYRQYLTQKFNYRLALSATLDRYGDKEGTEYLHSYFGKECINYNLERAIKEGKLTKYFYYPIVVYLKEEELQKYDNISFEISKCIIKEKNGDLKLNKKGEILALERARLIAAASNKLEKLEEVILPYKEKSNLLVYCGATNLNLNDDNNKVEEKELKQITAVTRLLGNKLHMNVSKFTSEETSEERQKIKVGFVKKEIQAIVAIKCLDEGVNIPAINTAFILASSTNPKEYIQRRGRVLRKYEGKKYAEIYDFITLPRPLDEVPMLTEEQMKKDYSLVKKELKRMLEFSDLSENKMDAKKIMWDIEDIYKLKESDLEDTSYE